MVGFYVVFLIAAFFIFINSIGEDIDLIKFYYLLVGALFYLVYRIACVADSTWTMDESTLSFKGVSILFSKKITMQRYHLQQYLLTRLIGGHIVIFFQQRQSIIQKL
jgi:hypothetical protein